MLSKLGCLATVTAIGALATVTTGSASTERHGRTIHLGVRFHDDQLDLGAPGPSVGDELVVHDTLVNRHGRTVGSDAGVCTFTGLEPPVASCVLTFVLAQGQIATQFRNTPPRRKLAAIVGGTGAYRGASGQLVLVEGPNQTGTATFHLQR
jgi:hypothetical protein